MKGIDAKFLYSETPTAHMHTVKVAVSDASRMPGGFSYDVFVATLRDLLVHLPMFRRRAVPVPLGLSHPVWVEDAGFELERHVRRVHVPPPGSDRELAGVVAEHASRQLPRDRPLWDMVVVDGLAGGRIAVVAKIHHAVADGSAAVAMLQNVVSGLSETSAHVEDRWSPEELPSRRDLLHLARQQQAGRLRTLPDLAVRSVQGAVASERSRRSLDTRPPLPLQTPRTPLNAALTPDRTFAMTDLPLEPLKSVRRATGATLNDVYLAVCSGAVRSYLADLGQLPPRSLVASVPVAIDPRTRRASGNHVDNLYVSLGTHVADPLARLRHCSAMARAAKQVRSTLGNELMEERAEIVPPQLYVAAVRSWSRSRLSDHVRPPVNLVLSNVAGPREPIRLGDIPLDALYSVGPILDGIGVNITAWSYVDMLGISVLGCRATLPDPWLVIDALHESADELVAAAGRET